jgi:hypothetical protein
MPLDIAYMTGQGELRVCHLPDCRDPQSFTTPPRGNGRIRWTPDGRGVAIIDAGRTNLTVQPLDGRPAYALTQFTDLDIADFGWSADGTHLAIARRATTTDIVLFRGLR